jgi:hypothetical protein
VSFVAIVILLIIRLSEKEEFMHISAAEVEETELKFGKQIV